MTITGLRILTSLMLHIFELYLRKYALQPIKGKNLKALMTCYTRIYIVYDFV